MELQNSLGRQKEVFRLYPTLQCQCHIDLASPAESKACTVSIRASALQHVSAQRIANPGVTYASVGAIETSTDMTEHIITKLSTAITLSHVQYRFCSRLSIDLELHTILVMEVDLYGSVGSDRKVISIPILNQRVRINWGLGQLLTK